MTTRIDAIRKRLEAATKGPWYVSHDGSHVSSRLDPNGSTGSYHFAVIHGWTHETRHNGEFIAHAPQDIAFLLERLDAMGKDLREAQDAAIESQNIAMKWMGRASAVKAVVEAARNHIEYDDIMSEGLLKKRLQELDERGSE